MEPLIAATRRLADLALTSPHQTPPRLLFVSSVNVFNSKSLRWLPDEEEQTG